MAKIIVTVRTLNEEANIADFCESYKWADLILITDGGSTDQTVRIAERLPRVKVLDVSHLQIPMAGSPLGFITPEPHQTNIGIKWAVEQGADWIIRDEADCWPNPALRLEARQLLDAAAEPSVFVNRLYLWGGEEYFPKYNRAGQSLWAWRPDRANIYCDESRPLANGLKGLPPAPERLLLEPPYVCLHHFCPDETTIERKRQYYAAIGSLWTHPLVSIYAPPEPLPAWVYDEL